MQRYLHDDDGVHREGVRQIKYRHVSGHCKVLSSSYLVATLPVTTFVG